MFRQQKLHRPNSFTTRMTCVIAFLAVFSALMPTPVEAAPVKQDIVNCPIVHFVQKGETLGIIALMYGISVKAILDANALFPPYNLVEWQPLCIPRVAFKKLYPNATINAYIFLNRLTIWGTCFPSINSYTVKMKIKPLGAWNIVGFLRVENDGTYKALYMFPESISNANNYQVCLKEQVEGYNVCTSVDKRWVSGQRYKFGSEWITIPTR